MVSCSTAGTSVSGGVAPQYLNVLSQPGFVFRRPCSTWQPVEAEVQEREPSTQKGPISYSSLRNLSVSKRKRYQRNETCLRLLITVRRATVSAAPSHKLCPPLPPSPLAPLPFPPPLSSVPSASSEKNGKTCVDFILSLSTDC